MLEFILISGVLTTTANGILGKIMEKSLKKRGYVCLEEKNKRKEIIGICTNFIPYYNFVKTGLYTVVAVTFALVDERIKERMLSEPTNFKKSTVFKASKAKEEIDKYEKNYPKKEIVDAMKLEGATDNQIEEELKMIEAENIEASISEKRYREIEAMSDSELWLKSIYMDVGLSDDEKLYLFSEYAKQFKKDQGSKKDKAIQKTTKMIDNRNNK